MANNNTVSTSTSVQYSGPSYYGDGPTLPHLVGFTLAIVSLAIALGMLPDCQHINSITSMLARCCILSNYFVLHDCQTFSQVRIDRNCCENWCNVETVGEDWRNAGFLRVLLLSCRSRRLAQREAAMRLGTATLSLHLSPSGLSPTLSLCLQGLLHSLSFPSLAS